MLLISLVVGIGTLAYRDLQTYGGFISGVPYRRKETEFRILFLLLMDKQPVYQDICVEFSSTGWRSFLIRQQKLVWKFAKLAITYHQILAGFSVIIHPMHLWILYRSSHRLLLANLWLWLSFYVVDRDWGRNSVWKMHYKWEHIICNL